MQGFPFDSHVTFDESGIPQYDRGVSSQPLRKLIAKLFTSGVMPNPSDNLQVSAGSDGMTVIVQKGFAVTDGGLCPEENVRTLSVTASHPTLDRIDTVVVRWNENDDVRKADLHILQGVPAKNPVRPTLTRTSSIYELGLADIFVTKGVATITNEKITDTRMESSRCGIVSSVSEWDTTTIYQQIQSDLAGFKTNEQAEFMTWFNKMKDQLTTDAAGKLQTEVDDVRGQICTNLLNPTAQTQTAHGVTFTNNGDGTYTVDGTATDSTVYFLLSDGFTDLDLARKYKIVGCPQGGSENTYTLYDDRNSSSKDTGKGVVYTPTYQPKLYIRIIKGVTVNNLLFKPMLTTDLNATYDDYVPYTGDSGRLNEDVSELFDIVRPVGSLYSTTDANFNPNTAKGWHGVWERITDCVIYAAGDSDTVGQIVGSNTHTLTEAELPSHRHTIPSLSGKTNIAGTHSHYSDYPKWMKNALRTENEMAFAYAGGWTQTSNTSQNGEHEHTVTTNASNTDYTGSGTAIDIRPRRLNSVVWRRTA